jgi:hypothetical protein
MKKKRENESSPEDDAVFLEDLVPRDDVRGGSGKLRFGQEPAVPRPSPSDERDGLRKRGKRGD